MKATKQQWDKYFKRLYNIDLKTVSGISSWADNNYCFKLLYCFYYEQYRKISSCSSEDLLFLFYNVFQKEKDQTNVLEENYYNMLYSVFILEKTVLERYVVLQTASLFHEIDTLVINRVLSESRNLLSVPINGLFLEANYLLKRNESREFKKRKPDLFYKECIIKIVDNLECLISDCKEFWHLFTCIIVLTKIKKTKIYPEITQKLLSKLKQHMQQLLHNSFECCEIKERLPVQIGCKFLEDVYSIKLNATKNNLLNDVNLEVLLNPEWFELDSNKTLSLIQQLIRVRYGFNSYIINDFLTNFSKALSNKNIDNQQSSSSYIFGLILISYYSNDFYCWDEIICLS